MAKLFEATGKPSSDAHPTEDAGELVPLAEVDRRISAAVGNAIEKVMAALAAQPAPAPAAAPVGDMIAFVQQLAKSIAEVGNQGTGKVVVDPAVMQSRDDSYHRMIELIAVAWRDQTPPEYELNGKVHLEGANGPQLIEPLYTDQFRQTRATRITWYGAPNKQMTPANPVAATIYDEFKSWVGHVPGVTSNIRQIDPKGRLITPGGNVMQDLQPMPKGYMVDPALVLKVGGDVTIDREVPHTGLQIAAQGVMGKTKSVNILGSIVAPAVERVA